MPVIIRRRGKSAPQPRQRVGALLSLQTRRNRAAVALSLTVGGRQRAGVVLSLATQALRNRAAVSLSLKTWQPTPPAPLPVPPALEGVDRVIPPAGHEYLILHGGQMLPIESYSLSWPDPTSATDPGSMTQAAKATGTVTCRGEVAAGGQVSIIVSAVGVNGGSSYAAAYGPFTATEATVDRRGVGVTTTLTLVDSTAADAAAMMPLLDELIPWERNKHLSAQEQAGLARRKAEQQRAIEQANQRRREGEPCLTEPVDTRRVPVNTVILWALGFLPVKWALTAPLPWGSSYFSADPEAEITQAGGWVGVSYGTYRKTPLGVVSDLLGMLGWKAVARGGVIWIGPPGTLLEQDEVSGVLGVPLSELTETSVKTVNVAATLSADPQAAKGDYSRPRWIDFQGASYRHYLPPLPPEKPEDTFELARNMTISGESRVESSEHGLESVTRWSKTKAGGLLVEEREQTGGLVTNTEALLPARIWKSPRSVTVTTHEYRDANYPRAETLTVIETKGWVEYLNRTDVTERKVTRQRWDATGYLREKVATTKTMNGWDVGVGGGGTGDLGSATVGGVTINLSAQLNYALVEETETWLPIRPGWWQHKIVRVTNDFVPELQDGTPVDAHKATKTETPVNDPTDQGPPRAPGGNCAEPTRPEGFPDDVPLEARVYTGGRAEPAAVSAPWAHEVPDFAAQYLQAIKASSRNERRYTCRVPIQAPDGGRGTGRMSVSGKHGSYTATVEVSTVAT